jgi:hypothetical protein
MHFVMLAAKVGTYDTELRKKPFGTEAEEISRQLPSNIFVQFLAGPSDIREGGLGWLLARSFRERRSLTRGFRASRHVVHVAVEQKIVERRRNRFTVPRADLEGADLKLAHFQGAILEGANLKGAELSWAQLQGADLARAQLQGADLGATGGGFPASRARVSISLCPRRHMQHI